MKAVLDASPIIAFFDELAAPGALLLVRQLGYELLVPDAVCREDILREPSASILANCFAGGSMSRVDPSEPDVLDRFQRLHPALGAGESEVMIAVHSFRASSLDAICVLDEKAARGVAQALGLPVIGTLGLITLLRQAQLVSMSEEAILKRRLKSSTFRIDERLLR